MIRNIFFFTVFFISVFFYAQKNNTEEAKKMIDIALKLNPTEQNKEIKKLIYKED